MNSIKTVYALFITLLLLLLPAKGFPQDDIRAKLRKSFEIYISKYPWEDVYIHTDRSEYISGEEIWFSSWVLNRGNNSLSDLSSILYVEVLNSQNVPVSQKRIVLKNGYSSGNLFLPDTLSSGRYTLRGYTRWMRNFMPANCFRKTINIYNTLTSGSRIKLPGRIPYREAVPAAAREYSGSGLRAAVAGGGNSDFIVTIEKTGFNGNNCILFIRTGGKIDYCERIVITEDLTTLRLNHSSLSKGINHLTFFSSDGLPLYELYSYNGIPEGNEAKADLADTVGRRSAIDLKLLAAGASTADMDSVTCSISVSQESGWFYNTPSTDWIVTGSEFGFMPEELGINSFSGLDEKSISIMLSKLRSEWIDWKQITGGGAPQIKFEAEQGYHFISGKLLSRENRSPMAGYYLFLSTPGKNASFSYSRTGQDGLFSYPVKVSDRNYDFIIQPESPDIQGTIVMESPFSSEYRELPASQGIIEAEIPAYIFRWGANHQVSRIYGVQSSLAPAENNKTEVSMSRFYGKPDVELKLEDYIKLPVMQEVFFELLPGVPLRSRKSGYEIRMLDPIEQKPFLKPPVLFVDGVVVNDAGVIAGLDPEGVEQIDVVKDRYIVGNYLFYGIVNVITKRGDFSAVTLPEYSVRIRFRTSDPVSGFNSVLYDSGDKLRSRTPDFRNTLYWNSSVLPAEKDALFRFWSSDIPGNYTVTVQGFTKSGKPFSLKRMLVVK